MSVVSKGDSVFSNITHAEPIWQHWFHGAAQQVKGLFQSIGVAQQLVRTVGLRYFAKAGS